MNYTQKTFNKLFDHTLLKPDATIDMMRTHCMVAAENGFCTVAVNGGRVKECAEILHDYDVKVDSSSGFPLGAMSIAAKAEETRLAIIDGADEVDYVINIGKLKEGKIEYIREEMKTIVSICREKDVISKVIFENCYLTDDEKKVLCEVALDVMPDFIKTSTGFGTGGATVEDVRLMKSMVGDKIKVKAAGGIRDLETCLAMLEAGAERIGTSAGVAIAEAFAKTL
ncbi:MAG: deoxyribose-phosphate aldolase [Clostridia bacterium]|nr:deoxyribose-phosphate aldolase [Clostridia bacterium]